MNSLPTHSRNLRDLCRRIVPDPNQSRIVSRGLQLYAPESMEMKLPGRPANQQAEDGCTLLTPQSVISAGGLDLEDGEWWSLDFEDGQGVALTLRMVVCHWSVATTPWLILFRGCVVVSGWVTEDRMVTRREGWFNSRLTWLLLEKHARQADGPLDPLCARIASLGSEQRPNLRCGQQLDHKLSPVVVNVELSLDTRTEHLTDEDAEISKELPVQEPHGKACPSHADGLQHALISQLLRHRVTVHQRLRVRGGGVHEGLTLRIRFDAPHEVRLCGADSIHQIVELQPESSPNGLARGPNACSQIPRKKKQQLLKDGLSTFRIPHDVNPHLSLKSVHMHQSTSVFAFVRSASAS